MLLPMTPSDPNFRPYRLATSSALSPAALRLHALRRMAARLLLDGSDDDARRAVRALSAAL